MITSKYDWQLVRQGRDGAWRLHRLEASVATLLYERGNSDQRI